VCRSRKSASQLEHRDDTASCVPQLKERASLVRATTVCDRESQSSPSFHHFVVSEVAPPQQQQ